jgi:SAM-dependent methyltransferase
MTTTLEDRWNHNLHYHWVVLAAAPANCRRALDVGCGEGTLARDLLLVSERVVGIDVHRPSIERGRHEDARRYGVGGLVNYVVGDVMTHPFEPGSFDLVASVAALHHLDARAALTRMQTLVRPGGTLAVVSPARSRLPRDLAWEVAGAVTHRVVARSRTYWEHSAPMVWPPPFTYHELRRIARSVLPGVRFRRHLLWRCSLVWTKPA